MKPFLGLLVVCFAALAFGVRVHPERMTQRFQKDAFEHYWELEFFSGQKMAGQLVSESDDSVEITVGSGTAFFKKNEIKNRRPLDPEEVKAGRYADRLIRRQPKDLAVMTIRYEDSAGYGLEIMARRLFAELFHRFEGRSSATNSLKPMLSLSNTENVAEPVLPPNFSLKNAGIASSAVRGLTADPSEQQKDFAALLQSGLDQLRKSSN